MSKIHGLCGITLMVLPFKIGVNKHWHMLCIHHRMITQGGVVIPTRLIWKHLQSLYDLAALVRMEISKF